MKEFVLGVGISYRLHAANLPAEERRKTVLLWGRVFGMQLLGRIYFL